MDPRGAMFGRALLPRTRWHPHTVAGGNSPEVESRTATDPVQGSRRTRLCRREVAQDGTGQPDRGVPRSATAATGRRFVGRRGGAVAPVVQPVPVPGPSVIPAGGG